MTLAQYEAPKSGSSAASLERKYCLQKTLPVASAELLCQCLLAALLLLLRDLCDAVLQHFHLLRDLSTSDACVFALSQIPLTFLWIDRIAC